MVKPAWGWSLWMLVATNGMPDTAPSPLQIRLDVHVCTLSRLWVRVFLCFCVLVSAQDRACGEAS
jgi:hypothetical protein